MYKRPQLKPGDVCRLHKKARKAFQRFRNATFVVLRVLTGDGIEGRSVIECQVIRTSQYQKINSKTWMKRQNLWYTGYNNQNAQQATETKPVATSYRRGEKRCECGGDSIRAGHSNWCPKYKE